MLRDEPFSAPYEITAQSLRTEFAPLVRENGKTANFITHSINEAFDIGDRIVVLKRPAKIAHDIRMSSSASHADGGHESWDDSNRSIFLFGGFALENALKPSLVFENPSWISNGRLGGPLRSHSLTRLQTVPYRNRLLYVLKGFEEGIES